MGKLNRIFKLTYTEEPMATPATELEVKPLRTDILSDKTITTHELRLYKLIKGTGRIYEATSNIARCIGSDKVTTQESITHLAELGYIEIDVKNGLRYLRA